MIRLVPDQSDQIERAAEVTITFDGQPVMAHAGETVLAALMRAGVRHLRDAPDGNAASRGGFCCMGLCQECVVQIDGVRIESCRQVASEGLEIISLRRSSK